MVAAWVAAVSMWNSQPLLAPILGGAVTVAVGVTEYLRARLRTRFRALSDQRLEHDGDRLRQVAADGSSIAVIELERPFEVTWPLSVQYQGIYEIVQRCDGEGTVRLRFGTHLDGAEEVVREVLKSNDWPPGRLDD